MCSKQHAPRSGSAGNGGACVGDGAGDAETFQVHEAASERRTGEREPAAATLPWLWHAVLALVPALVLAALWIDPARASSDLARAQLEIARVGLPVLAAGVFGVWLLRRTITADVGAVFTRWQAAPAELVAEDLIPSLAPPLLPRILWFALAAWALTVTVGLVRASSWVQTATNENGLLETATVLAYLGGMVFAAIGWRRSLRRPRSLRAVLLLGLAAACFLIAAEETDWGQTYLRYATPGAFEDANIQQDFSLHNLAPPSAVPGTRWANWLLRLLALLGGAVLPLLLWRAAIFRRFAWALEAPLPPWWAQAVFFVAVWIPDLPERFARENVGSELREFSIAVAVLVWLWANASLGRRLRRER